MAVFTPEHKVPYLMPVYRIIKDEEELQKFVDQLPDLGEGFKYYISLFARKKYGGTEGLKSDKAQLKRCVASKDMIIKKIKQMEIPVGCYDIDGLVINQESLVVYISANPRDMHKAGIETALALTRKGLHGEIIKNPQAETLSQIQVHGKKIYFNVDLDIIEGQKLSEDRLREWLSNCINLEACTIVRTRGGYHILIKLDDIDDQHKRWYNFFKLGDYKIVDRFTVDLSNGDGMLPIPGCVQAEFIPRML